MKNDPLKLTGMHNGASPQIFRNASKLRKDMTETEEKLWEYLKTNPLGIKFRRQHPIGRYVLDFYCHKLRFSIEIDGGYHLNKVQQEKDKERTDYLSSIGIKEIRFSNKDVMSKFQMIKEKIDSLSRVDLPLGIEGKGEQGG